jgi:hypothetical protein
MLKSVRWIVFSAVLLTGFALSTPAARADEPNMQDYNTYWQVAQDPTPPSTDLSYNTYWAEVQAKQEWQNRQQ